MQPDAMLFSSDRRQQSVIQRYQFPGNEIILLKHMEVLNNTLTASHSDLLDKVHSLSDGISEISSYYHEYDYDADTPGNGFRSFVKILQIFILKLSAVSMLNPSLAKMVAMSECDTFADTLTKSLQVARLIRQKGSNFTVMNESSELDQEIFARVFQFNAQDIAPLYSELGPFFLLRDFQHQFKQNMFLVNLLSVPLLSQIRMVTNSRFAAQIQSHHATSGTISSLKAASLRTFPVNILMKVLMTPPGVSTSWITVSRESPWLIRVSDSKSPATVEQSNAARGGFIRCLLIQPNLVRDNSQKSMILFLHGGGFVTGSPEGYTDFLSRSSKQLSVPVLIPDYAKAPERPYPAAIQDVLDVYHFLSSGDERVSNMIGFDPENILLSGDSAGSNLALALTFALNQIQKSGTNNNDNNNEITREIRMPKSLALQYPSMTGFIAVPSTTILTFDPILTQSLYAISRSFYAELDPPVQDDLWYKKESDVKNIMSRTNNRLKDPFLNMMAYTDWADLKDIRLYIVGSEMDSILDHSILLAKKWQGPVKLEIARDMPHGFLIGVMSNAVLPTIKLCTDHFAEGLNIKA